MTNIEKRFSDAAVVLEKSFLILRATQRYLSRQLEDMAELSDKLQDVSDEYDRLVSNWSDSEGDDNA
ncbi:MAG: hypothetical protein M0R06_08700 [Sphaerochaeta sp.]|jgi:hypothetical protein|nr:hypothetical protein [Sphaerochaeta sp.]